MGQAWDTALFRAVHLGWHQAWLDPVMRALTDPGVFKIPILVAIGLCFLTRRARGAVGLAVLALTLTVSDQTSATVLKPIFKRPRPSVVLADARPLFGVRHSFSFPSVHATNFFAAAPVIAAVFPEVTVAAYAVAGAVSLSRVYVGDHWPSDVAAGAGLGFFLGFLGRRAYGRLTRTLIAPRRGEASPSGGP
ncbi:MAG TPA: phosphatase PAP2 family protein [Candidatus Eisenbacteria bacterium]